MVIAEGATWPFLREDQFERGYELLQREAKFHTKDREGKGVLIKAVYGSLSSSDEAVDRMATPEPVKERL